MRGLVLAAAAAIALAATSVGAAPPPLAEAPPAFMAFPLATQVSGARHADAYAWLVRQGDLSIVMFARGPDFKPVRLADRSDVDGQLITAIELSPDGKRIAFMTGAAYGGEHAYNPAGLVEAPKPTLWLLDTSASGEAKRIGPGVGPTFSPDGARLLYRHGEDLRIYEPGAAVEDRVAAKGGARWGDVAWFDDGQSLLFTDDKGGYSFLGRYRLGADRVEWLATGTDRIASPVLSPDQRRVAFVRFPGRLHGVTYDQTESEPMAVEVLDLADGTRRELYRSKERAQLPGLEDGDQAVRWIGDGRVAFLSEADGWARLYAAPATGGAVTSLTPGGCETAESEPGFGAELMVLSNCRDIQTRQLSVVDAATARSADLPLGSDLVAASARASGGRYLAYVGGTADSPPLLRVMDLKSRKLAMAERPQDYGWTPHFTAPAPKAVTFKAADGQTVSGQLFEPSTPGPHPALIYVHGGPQRQMFPAFHYMDYYANDYAANRRFAELGFVVLSVNYRSGVGYGRAWREAEGRGWRGASEYQDVVAGERFLAARPEVDPGRVGIWGGSYGGLLTGQALARNSDLFKAGVAIHGVFDWSWPSARPYHLNPSRFFGVDPKDKAQALAASPLGAIDGWRSPVLLFHGEGDQNVDVEETVDLARRLRDRGVEVKTVIVPGEAHSFVRHSTWVRLWQEESEFLRAHLAH